MIKPLFTPVRFCVVLMAFLFLVSLLKYHDRHITTSFSPKGIVSFELNTSRDEGLQMLKAWKGEGIGWARNQTYFDFLFIVVYTLLACMLLEWSATQTAHKWWLKGGMVLALLAGAMDVIENIFILQALRGPERYEPAGIFVPSYIKVGLLLIVAFVILILSLRWLSQGISVVAKVLWMFRIVFGGLLFCFIILFVMDQGQDLLLSINSCYIGPMVTLVAVSLFALGNWYLPKYYDTENTNNFTLKAVFLQPWDYENGIYREKTFTGRLLGAASFVLPGAGILHAMQVFGIHYWVEFLSPFTCIAILMLLYYLILRQSWLCDRKWVITIAIASLALIIIFGCIQGHDKPVFLALFAVDFFLLSFVLLLYTNIRKGTYSIDLFNGAITPYILFVLLGVSLLFLIFNINPSYFAFRANRRFLTLPIVFSGIIFYTFFFSMLLIAGKRYHVQFISFLLTGALILSIQSNNNFHRIRYVVKQEGKGTRAAPDTTGNYARYDSANDYARQWLLLRKDEIASYNQSHGDAGYPVFIVNAYGGGIRAAAWTSKIIGALDKAVLQRSANQNNFQHYVFAYSGASGGTIGASVLCAQRYRNLQTGYMQPDTAETFYNNDFLTPVLIALLGRDLWLSPFGREWADDRAALQEQAWEFHANDNAHHFDYSLPMSDYWCGASLRVKYDIPLLFANSYDIDSGLKVVVAPVLLRVSDFPASLLLNNRIHNSYGHLREMRLSTGAFLSARFPVISPEAKFDGFSHFMDGGLKENSGAETASEIRRMFTRTSNKLGDTIGRIRIFMLSLPNTIAGTDSVQIAKNVFELTAPLTALMNNWVGNTYKADSINLLLRGVDDYDYMRIRPVQPRDTASKMMPVLPLGWQMSDLALAQLDSSITDKHNRKKIDSVANRITEGHF